MRSIKATHECLLPNPVSLYPCIPVSLYPCHVSPTLFLYHLMYTRELNLELVAAGYPPIRHTFDIWHLIKVRWLYLLYFCTYNQCWIRLKKKYSKDMTRERPNRSVHVHCTINFVLVLVCYLFPGFNFYGNGKKMPLKVKPTSNRKLENCQNDKQNSKAEPIILYTYICIGAAINVQFFKLFIIFPYSTAWTLTWSMPASISAARSS